MATQLQIRRGTSAQVAAFTGAEGEIVVNTTNDSVHVNDGSTAGGFELARADLNNVSDTNLNAALTGNTLASLTITSADINGGTIDNTVIGGSTAAAGSFTTGTFNRNTNDGNIVEFNRSGSPVGSIGTLSGYLTIGDDAGILFNNANPSISAFNVSANANRDAEIDLGASNARFKDLYTMTVRSSTGTASAPAYSFAADTNSGMFLNSADTLCFATAGTERIRISNGNVGIGTSSLASGDKLTVAGRTKINSLYLGEVSSNYDLIQSTSSAGLRLLSTGGSVYLDSSGDVSIGTASFPSEAKLHVEVATSNPNAGSPTDSSAVMINGGTTTVGNGPVLALRNLSGSKETIARLTAETVSGNNGDLTISVYAGGSTIDEKLRIQSGGGISFNGDTAAANALDDFETGTWTPTLIAGTTNPTGGSAQSPIGAYTKIGNRVFVTFYVGRSYTNSPSGLIYISGLPYTILNSSQNNAFFNVSTYNIDYGSSGVPFGIPQPNTQTVAFYSMTSNSGWNGLEWQNHANGTIFISGQFSYIAA